MKKPLLLLIVGAWAGVCLSQVSPQAIGQEIPLNSPKGVAASLLPFVKDQDFAGAVTLVASKDKVLSLETVGYSDLAAKRAMRADDLFLICSMTKVFTAAGVMMLVDEGKLSIDDPVEKYLPEFKGQMVAVREVGGQVRLKKPAHPITIKNLLTHTSGLPTKTNGLIPLSESVPQHAAKPLGFEPDTQWLYSNVGINTAGRIIEVVSGMPYGEFIEKRLLTPLGLKDTTFWPTPAQAARIAKPYQRNNGTGKLEFAKMGAYPTPSSDRKCVAQPCSGLFSTAADIGRFCQMFLHGGVADGRRVLSGHSVRQMTTVQTGSLELHGSLVEGCGLGWRVARRAPPGADTLSVGTFSHGGALKTGMWVDPRRQLVLVVMMQLNSPQRPECQRAVTKAALAAFAKDSTAVAPTAAPAAPARQPTKVGARASAPGTFDRARFFPAPGHEQAMLHGKFCGSNVSARSGYEVLAEITSAPPAGKWTELSFPNTKKYRWIRYEAPPGSRGMVAEMEFYVGKQRAVGRTFGSFGWRASRNWPRAFDRQTGTWFESDCPDGQYVGVDVGDRATAQTPEMDPPPCERKEPLRVALQCATPGAVVRYSFSGAPTQKEGIPYQEPIRIERTTTIFAVAFKDGMPQSPVASGTYIIGQPPKAGLHTLHVGNSLTAALRRLPTFLRTAGLLHEFQEQTQGGGQTVLLWNSVHSQNKEMWEKTLAAMPQIDHFTVQPRSPQYDDVYRAVESKHDILFFNTARAKSPHVQPWIYAEWPARRPGDRSSGWREPIFDSRMQPLYPAPTFEEASAALLMHVEAIQRKVLETYREGKRPRILPCVLAVARLKNLLDEGKMPGLTAEDFDPLMFYDNVHPGTPCQYMLGMTWFAAFYRQSPEGKILPVAVELSPAQASAMQRLAWDVVKNYPDCGLYEAGTTPCGKPQFSSAPQKVGGMTRVTLGSATPGAWFRYTLDGTPPTRTRGYVYCGLVSVRPGTTVKAVAYQSGMADSPVAETTCPAGQR